MMFLKNKNYIVTRSALWERYGLASGMFKTKDDNENRLLSRVSPKFFKRVFLEVAVV